MTEEGKEFTTIPESEWKQVQQIMDRIYRRSMEQDEDISNLNNLLHTLHGEGVRNRKYTLDGRPAVFVNGEWVSR